MPLMEGELRDAGIIQGQKRGSEPTEIEPDKFSFLRTRETKITASYLRLKRITAFQKNLKDFLRREIN